VEEQEYEKDAPPTNKNGEDSSTTLAISGSALKVAVKALTGPSEGFAPILSAMEAFPSLRNCKNRPYIRNHLLALLDIVESTSALMTALSMPAYGLKIMRPTTTSIIESISICTFLQKRVHYNFVAYIHFHKH